MLQRLLFYDKYLLLREKSNGHTNHNVGTKLGHSDFYHLTSTLYSLLREYNRKIMKRVFTVTKDSRNPYGWAHN